MPEHENMSEKNSPNNTTTLQVRVYPEVRSAARIRAEQRKLSLGGHISDLIQEDAEKFDVWSLINREGACDD